MKNIEHEEMLFFFGYVGLGLGLGPEPNLKLWFVPGSVL